MSLKDTLNGIASTLSLIPSATTLPPGQVVDLDLTPPVAGTSVTSTIDGALNLVWLSKQVRFTDSGLVPPGTDLRTYISGHLAGAMPIPVLEPGGSVTDVPGAISQLAATLR